MPTQPTGVADAAPVAGTVTEVDVLLRPSPDLVTTTTADPSTGGTTLAVTNGAAVNRAGHAGGFYIRVIGTSGVPEIMLVTAGGATNSWTVTRGQMGTTGVAHSVGATVSLMVGVQRVEPVEASPIVTYKGRVSTFKTLGRAGTTGQKIFALHNASGSTVIADVEKITVDCMQTAARVVEQPLVRLWRFTAVPTNGSSITKTPEDSAISYNSSIKKWQDASADNTGSGTTLTVTLPAGTILASSWGPRALTLVGYEQFDRETFFEDEGVAITLRAGEGICVFLDYTAATANPVTDKWVVSCRWTEYRTV
jgi:hypothetical protein